MSRPWVRCGAGRRSAAVPRRAALRCSQRIARLRPRCPHPARATRPEGSKRCPTTSRCSPPTWIPSDDAIERLEWARRARGGDAALAAEGAHAAHRADRRRRRPGHGDPDRVRRRRRQQQQQRDDVDGQGADQRRHAGDGHLQAGEEVQVRLRQPRDDEPVLRPDALRRRGRVQAAGLQLPVDGLGELERQRDGQRLQHRHHRRRGRHRGRARRRQGVQRPHRRGAEGEDPRGLLQRGLDRERAPVLHRPGPVRVGRRDGQAHRRARPVRRRGAVHRHAGPGQHPAAHRRRQGHAEVASRPSSRT